MLRRSCWRFWILILLFSLEWFLFFIKVKVFIFQYALGKKVWSRLVVRVEILAFGDKLCYGQVYDVNSYWLVDQVTRLGGFVRRIIYVRDDVREICDVFKEMLNREPDFFLRVGLGRLMMIGQLRLCRSLLGCGL